MIEVGAAATSRLTHNLYRIWQVPHLALSPAASRWWPLWPPLIIGSAAFAAIGLTHFDGLYGQDAFAYFGYATGALRMSVLHLQPPPPFYWPPGYPIAVALVSIGVGNTPFAGQLVSIAGGAAVACFTVLLAQEAMLGVPEGKARSTIAWSSLPIVAGIITATTGQLLQSSIVVMADTIGLAAATAAAWSLLRYARTRAVRWLIISSVAFAWAIISRWIYGLVAIPFAVYALLILVRTRPRGRAVAHAAIAAVAGGLVMAPVVLPAVAAWVAGADPPFAGQFRVYSWNPMNALRSDFTTTDGHLHYSIANGLYYALAPAQWWYATPLLAALIPFGFWAAMNSRAASLRLLTIWAISVCAFHAGAPWQNARFTLAYLPPLAILAAIGFAQAWRAPSRSVQVPAAACLVLGIVLSAVGSAVLTARFIDRKRDDLATVQWVVERAPAEAQLLTFGLTATFQRYSRIETIDLAEVAAPTIQHLIADGRPTLVLLDVGSVERQWTGQPPWQNFRMLRDGPGLATLGGRGPYTLFSVHT